MLGTTTVQLPVGMSTSDQIRVSACKGIYLSPLDISLSVSNNNGLCVTDASLKVSLPTTRSKAIIPADAFQDSD